MAISDDTDPPPMLYRPEDAHRRARRAGLAGLAGSFIEYYDFTTYAFLVIYLAPLFFQSQSPAAAIIAAFGVYAVGYLARPVGGLVLGSLGDRRGRRLTLLVTVIGMGGATTVMGLLPTYPQIGALAPALLVLMRLVQGFSTGGETSGAATLVAEAGARRHGLFQALSPAGATLGSAAAPAVVGLTTAILGGEAMATWGWRVPLLLSAVLTVGVLLYRLRVHESQEFVALAERHRLARSPLGALFRGHWRPVLGVVLLAAAVGVPSALLFNYMNVYMINVAGMAKSTVYWISAVGLALGTVGYIIGGSLADRFSARLAVLIGLAGLGILIYPAMALMIGHADAALITLLYTVVLIFLSIAVAPVWAIATRAFPTAMRYSGVATGMNVGGTLGQGFAPLVASALVASTGFAQAPALLIIGAAVLGIVVLLVVTRSARMQAEPREPEVAVAA